MCDLQTEYWASLQLEPVHNNVAVTISDEATSALLLQSHVSVLVMIFLFPALPFLMVLTYRSVFNVAHIYKMATGTYFPTLWKIQGSSQSKSSHFRLFSEIFSSSDTSPEMTWPFRAIWRSKILDVQWTFSVSVHRNHLIESIPSPTWARLVGALHILILVHQKVAFHFRHTRTFTRKYFISIISFDYSNLLKKNSTLSVNSPFV